MGNYFTLQASIVFHIVFDIIKNSISFSTSVLVISHSVTFCLQNEESSKCAKLFYLTLTEIEINDKTRQ